MVVCPYSSKKTSQSQVTLHIALKAVTARATLYQILVITIHLVYLPPIKPINQAELNHLFQQLLSPAILLGDFNASNILWADKTSWCAN